MNFVTGELVRILNELLAASIRYEMSGMVGKVRNLAGTEPSDISQLDCSGFVEYVIYKTSEHNENLPSGSRRQRDEIANSYAEIDYATAAPMIDNTVRIGFRDAVWTTVNAIRRRSQVGHVWLVINGRTYESTSRINRNKGPKSLLWSERSDDADHFYTLGPSPSFAMGQFLYTGANRIAAMF